ncbi:MAG: hypothetical protein EA350_01710 [Gemmatimonadales bacterium]|nr:MAG: hypothetical protein EA350_01710 [Gemmatimonadales bacterium]
MAEPKRIVTSGILSGLVGAGILAGWFLLVDQAFGEPFRTPAMIGSVLFGFGGMETSPGLIALFTVFHFAAFAVAGVMLAWALAQLERTPNLLFGLVTGFILFNAVFFLSAIGSGVSVVAELGWAEVLGGNLLAGIGMVSVLHATGVVRRLDWSEAFREGAIAREALVVGILSGFAVATWFLIVDTVQGRPFFTPSALGSVLFLGASDLSQVNVSLWITAAYTPIHYMVFVTIGFVASALVRQAERQPPILIGAMLLFVAFEAFFIGGIAILAEFLLGPLAWWNIAIGNLVAVLVIAGYFWRKHPALGRFMATEPIERPA